jgi:hypothetical protein
MNDFEDTWPTAPMHLPTGEHRRDPRPFWTPVIAALAAIMGAALAAVLL